MIPRSTASFPRCRTWPTTWLHESPTCTPRPTVGYTGTFRIDQVDEAAGATRPVADISLRNLSLGYPTEPTAKSLGADRSSPPALTGPKAT